MAMEKRASPQPTVDGAFGITWDEHSADKLANRNENSIALSIISNSQFFGEGLRIVLAYHLNFEVVATYTQENFALPADIPAKHVILIDGTMTQEWIVECIQCWRASQSPLYIVVLESSRATETVLAYIEAGANGYCVQGTSIIEVASVIKDVLQGLARCSPQVTAELFARLAGRTQTPVPMTVPPLDYGVLTTREMDVLRCLTLGYSNKQIAAELVITVYTVKHHVHNILEKLDMHHRREASHLAVTRGWVKD